MADTAEIRKVQNENGEFTYLKMDQRPDGVPEKFWNAENGLNLTALNNGYLTLESSRGEYKEATKRALQEEFDAKLPKAPAEYTVAAPKIEDAPQGFKYDPATDPVIQSVIGIGKDANLTQEALNKLTESRARAEIERFKSTGQRVVEVLGENAPARIEKLSSRLKDTLGDDGYQAVAELINDPAAVVALEKLTGNRGTPGSGAGAPEPELSEQKLRAMMNDPRYHDPMRRDPEYVKQIEQGFAALYDGTHDRSPRFTG